MLNSFNYFYVYLGQCRLPLNVNIYYEKVILTLILTFGEFSIISSVECRWHGFVPVLFLLYFYLRCSFVIIMLSTSVVIWFISIWFPWICCLTCKQSYHSISYILRFTMSKNGGKTKQIDYIFCRNWTSYLVSSIIIHEITFTATFETRPDSSNVVDLDELSWVTFLFSCPIGENQWICMST